MASITPNANGKRRLPHLDMTPMVDLGFLLITFFILTTSLSSINTLPMDLPDEKGLARPIKESTVMHIIIDDKKLKYYMGDNMKTNFNIESKGEFTALFKLHGERVNQAIANGKLNPTDSFCVLLKPTINSTVDDVVQVVNQIMINKISRYNLLTASKEESELF